MADRSAAAKKAARTKKRRAAGRKAAETKKQRAAEQEASNLKNFMTQQSALAGSKHAIEQFCSKFRQWAEACMTPLEIDDKETTEWRERFQEHWGFIGLAIQKSNLLWRLLYAGETLRKTPCPIHKGRWSGCFLDPPCDCSAYGNVTGWLPEQGQRSDKIG